MKSAHFDLPLFSWSPPSQVVPFPSRKRRAFVKRNAQMAAAMGDTGLENWLQHLLKQNRARLLRCGVDVQLVNEDTEALALALRSEVAIVRQRGGKLHD